MITYWPQNMHDAIKGLASNMHNIIRGLATSMHKPQVAFMQVIHKSKRFPRVHANIF